LATLFLNKLNISNLPLKTEHLYFQNAPLVPKMVLRNLNQSYTHHIVRKGATMKNNPAPAASAKGMENTESRNLQQATIYRILLAISFVHLFNDSIQAVIPAIFPILKDNMLLSFAQIGWISFALNMTSSVIQPVIGYAADRKSRPFLLPLGMCSTFAGVMLLAYANNCEWPIWQPVCGKDYPSLYFR